MLFLIVDGIYSLVSKLYLAIRTGGKICTCYINRNILSIQELADFFTLMGMPHGGIGHDRTALVSIAVNIFCLFVCL
jgi:hypothetical protein